MGTVVVDLSVSLDGFIAGADDGAELPLGRGGEALFTWMSAGPEANQVEARLTPPDASQVSVTPVLLGAGVRLFDALGPDPITLEQTRVIASDGVTHLRYRVLHD